MALATMLNSDSSPLRDTHLLFIESQQMTFRKRYKHLDMHIIIVSINAETQKAVFTQALPTGTEITLS